MAKSKRTEELEAAEAPVQSKRPRRAAAAVAAAKSTEQQQTQSAPKAGSKARSAKKPAAAGEGPQQGEQPSAAAAETKRKAAAKPAAKGKSTAAGSKEKPPYYLVKSEPDEFSIDALKARPNQTEGWEGVRNYVARNHLRAMKVGDQALFYHSSCKVPGVVGIVEVVREAYPDLTAQDSSSKYFDPKATADDPRWSMVDFKLVRQLRRQITLEELKRHKEGALSGMALFTTARLSVQPVSKQEWDFVLSLEDKEAADTA